MATSRLSFVVIDTMTSTPFRGNPTPVFILDHLPAWPSEESMQLIAREMNHSETAYVRRNSEKGFDIRWYTPTAEEPFCGHGILAAAKALYDKYNLTSIHFHTFSGIDVTALVSPNQVSKSALRVSMHFPSSPILSSLQIPEQIYLAFATALGIDISKILHVGLNSLKDIIIELVPEIDFSAVSMDIDPVALLNASPEGTRSQVITSRCTDVSAGDFKKRVFAYGGEDQATGSTYCALVPYWGSKLKTRRMIALQPSWRGGIAEVVWKPEEGLVEVVAECVQTVEGSVLVPDVQNSIVKAKL